MFQSFIQMTNTVTNNSKTGCILTYHLENVLSLQLNLEDKIYFLLRVNLTAAKTMCLRPTYGLKPAVHDLQHDSNIAFVMLILSDSSWCSQPCIKWGRRGSSYCVSIVQVLKLIESCFSFTSTLYLLSSTLHKVVMLSRNYDFCSS